MHKTLVVRKNEKEKGKCIKMTLWVASEQEIVLILTKNETMLIATKKETDLFGKEHKGKTM